MVPPCIASRTHGTSCAVLGTPIRDAAIYLCSEASQPRSMSTELSFAFFALSACPSHLTGPLPGGRSASVSKLISTHGSVDPRDAADFLHTLLSRIRRL